VRYEHEHDPDRRAQRLCEAMGDLLEETLQPAAPAADARSLGDLERALDDTLPPVAGKRRWLLAGSLAAGALAAAMLVAYVRRPLAYQVHGAIADSRDRVVAHAGQTVGVRFSDGSSIALLPESAGRIAGRSRHGATFALEHGRASFAVVHRPGARWLVQAGPYEIAVTGTRFDVSWSDAASGGLDVHLVEGAVTVRGALARGGIPLLAGQRLVARPDRHEVTVLPANDDADLPDPPPSLASAASASSSSLPRHARRAGRALAMLRTNRAQAPEAPAPTAPAPASPSTGEPPPAETIRDPRALSSEHRPPALDPPRVRAPRLDPDVPKHAGGNLCASSEAQFTFEDSSDDFYPTPYYLTAFKGVSVDRAHSWCGDSSLKLDADFNMAGRPNETGRSSFVGIFPGQVGEVGVRLAAPLDLTEREVSAHFYVDAPPYVHFAARVFVNNQGTWVPSRYEADLTPGRWWTIRHVFRSEPGRHSVNHVEKITFQIYAVGPEKVWSGSVYIDDFGWK
jgi:ferric-dicitrate binding protein FerR (iron transport regulator)